MQMQAFLQLTERMFYFALAAWLTKYMSRSGAHVCFMQAEMSMLYLYRKIPTEWANNPEKWDKNRFLITRM